MYCPHTHTHTHTQSLAIYNYKNIFASHLKAILVVSLKNRGYKSTVNSQMVLQSKYVQTLMKRANSNFTVLFRISSIHGLIASLRTNSNGNSRLYMFQCTGIRQHWCPVRFCPGLSHFIYSIAKWQWWQYKRLSERIFAKIVPRLTTAEYAGKWRSMMIAVSMLIDNEGRQLQRRRRQRAQC